VFHKAPDQDVKEFWATMEESLGTKILGYALGQYLSGRDPAKPLWGLLYLTETALYFRHFQQQNWISAISQSGGISRGNSEVMLEVQLTTDMVLQREPPAGFLWRLLRGSPKVFSLDSPGSAVPPFRFTVDQSDSPLIAELERLLSR